MFKTGTRRYNRSLGVRTIANIRPPLVSRDALAPRASMHHSEFPYPQVVRGRRACPQS
jgi:hypothetical protein